MIGRAARSLRNAALGLAFVRSVLREPITPESARAAVRARLAERPEALLGMLERAVFGHPGSPYRPLLDAAGYDLGRLRRIVADSGVEGALADLSRAGVYIAIEEFKGLQDARRGDRSWRFAPGDFDNPLVPGGLVASSGATRSRGIPSLISGPNLVLGAQHLALALDAYGVRGVPVAVWLPTSHGASLWALLVLLAMGTPPSRWFTQLPAAREGLPQHLRPFQLAIRGWAGLHRLRLPRPALAPLSDPSPIVAFLRDGGARGAVVFTTPSAALRLARAAREAGVRLDGVTFVTIGEPLTPAKLAGIEAAHARAFSSLGFTEFGRATYGCARPDGPDDTHVCRDALALGRRRRATGGGVDVDALLFTSLRPDARKILLNAETGDSATSTARRCGCALEAVGFTEHLREIRSFEKLNAEGALLFGSQLVAVVEERLPAQFGGDPTDYQLLEEEDTDGFTRLSVLVHPRLGPIDDGAIAAGFREILMTLRPAPVVLWAEAGTVRVQRRPPLVTGAGKLLPLVHLGRGEPPAR